jgi:Glycosyl transferase family 2
MDDRPIGGDLVTINGKALINGQSATSPSSGPGQGCSDTTVGLLHARGHVRGLSVNKALKLEPVGAPCEMPEPYDLSGERGYHRWVEAAQLYGSALRRSAVAPPSKSMLVGSSTNSRVLTVRIDRADQVELDGALQAAYCALEPGVMLVVDVPKPIGPREQFGLQRDLLSRALFKAGFDRSIIWAGRKILEAENQCSVVNRLLPSNALGAGPRKIPGIGGLFDVRPEQLVAIARRCALAPPAERPLRLSVVMPVYNEKETFCEVMEALVAKTITGFEIEICLVESNSTDGTRADVLRYADHPRVRLLLEDKPLGKGHAVRKGLELATGDIVVIQDADLEYDLADYEKLLAPIQRLESSFVLGSRHPDGNDGWQIRHFSEQRGVSDMMNVGHLFFTWFLNTIFRQQTRDPYTMYKVFRRDCINNVDFECNRFDFDLELFGKLIRSGFRPVEIGVRYNSRSFHEGKKVSIFADPPRWIRAGILHRFSNLHIWPKHC